MRRGGARRLRRAPLLLVEWLDAAGSTGSRTWQELSPSNYDDEPSAVRSVGWLLSETARTLTLVPHHHGYHGNARRATDANMDEADSGSGVLTIPKGTITRRTRLPDR